MAGRGGRGGDGAPGRPAGKAGGGWQCIVQARGALGKGIDLARSGCMGYRILTDQVLSPFGYNKTPT